MDGHRAARAVPWLMLCLAAGPSRASAQERSQDPADAPLFQPGWGLVPVQIQSRGPRLRVFAPAELRASGAPPAAESERLLCETPCVFYLPAQTHALVRVQGEGINRHFVLNVPRTVLNLVIPAPTPTATLAPPGTQVAANTRPRSSSPGVSYVAYMIFGGGLAALGGLTALGLVISDATSAPVGGVPDPGRRRRTSEVLVFCGVAGGIGAAILAIASILEDRASRPAERTSRTTRAPRPFVSAGAEGVSFGLGGVF